MSVNPEVASKVHCSVCGRSLEGRWAFSVGGGTRCLQHTLRYAPLLRRSLLTALCVGTVLTVINQGAVFVEGRLSASLFWQIPLTYCVPFCVATWGALINNRVT